MGKYYTFHKTVKGYLHEKKGIPCEDYSESYPEHDAGGSMQYYIAIVADGHGDTACMRSKLGSQKAAEIAKQCLIEFAESVVCDEQNSGIEQEDRYKGYRSINEILANAALYGKDAKDTLKARVPESLTNAIVSRWYAFVKEDLCQNPLSEDEIAQSSRYADAYREGRRLEHAYGTTLIAALMLPDYLLLIQQGDGRCDVFYEDGTVDQPIPWDERCHENVTTSMCDEDVVTSIRSRVIDLKEKQVIACYLGSDGVEDAYRDMEGTHMFYRGLSCELVERGTEAFEAYLDEMLPGFSQIGSGDDVSVSGIVDIEHIKNFAPSFKIQNKQYNLKEDLNRYENRIVSMSRKHGILYERVEEAEKQRVQMNNRLKMACSECNKIEETYQKAVNKADKWKQQWTKWENELEELKKQRRKNIELIPITPKVSKSGFSIPRENKDICIKKIKEHENAIKKYYPEYMKICEAETKLYDKVCEQKRNVLLLEQALKNVNKQFQEAQQEFDVYDQEYQAIQSEINRINNEIKDMDKEKEHISKRTGLDTNKFLEESVPLEKRSDITQEKMEKPHEETNHIGPECCGAEIVHNGQDDVDVDIAKNTEEQNTTFLNMHKESATQTDESQYSQASLAETDQQVHAADEFREDVQTVPNEQQSFRDAISIKPNDPENINVAIPISISAEEEEEIFQRSSNIQENINESIPEKPMEQGQATQVMEENIDIPKDAAENTQEKSVIQEEINAQILASQEEEESLGNQDYEPQAASVGSAYLKED